MTPVMSYTLASQSTCDKLADHLDSVADIYHDLLHGCFDMFLLSCETMNISKHREISYQFLLL